ncbi:hypothetical protein RRG08_033369, partial [Elysia crispata]
DGGNDDGDWGTGEMVATAMVIGLQARMDGGNDDGNWGEGEMVAMMMVVAAMKVRWRL